MLCQFDSLKAETGLGYGSVGKSDSPVFSLKAWIQTLRPYLLASRIPRLTGLAAPVAENAIRTISNLSFLLSLRTTAWQRSEAHRLLTSPMSSLWSLSSSFRRGINLGSEMEQRGGHGKGSDREVG